jgi:glycine/D-amino acid oxidase-like deaminating enzyme
VPSPIKGRVSHWYDGLPAYRPPLPGDRDADVCIVGAGYTGLWTAYYLKRADPSLRIAVLEARFAGFGASGRNGGWLSGLVPGDRNRMAREHGRDGVVAWQRALNEAVDEVIDVAAREGIDAGIVKGGTLRIARNAAQASRLADEIGEELSWKVDIERLTKKQAAEQIRLAGVLAATTIRIARVQPPGWRAVWPTPWRGLGVDIYSSRPSPRSPRRASTPRNRHRRSCCGDRGVHRRAARSATPLAPLNSSMIATEPISDDLWETIGWRGCETLGDTAHGFFYAQRTDDNRIAIGGRSVPYRYGSRTDADGRVSDRTIEHLTATLRAVLPQVRDVPIAHGWCGVLAVPRDWSASIALDKATGLGWAGGYVGHGVTATNLAGRTLADLVLDQRGPLTELPWVGHRSPNWEPEPLRWLGVRGMYLAYKLADWHEGRTGISNTSPIAVVADKIAGRP